MNKILLILLSFLYSIGASANDSYHRCTDANGNTLYTDRQCNESKDIVKAGSEKAVVTQTSIPIKPAAKNEDPTPLPDKIDMHHQQSKSPTNPIKPMP